LLDIAPGKGTRMDERERKKEDKPTPAKIVYHPSR